MRRARQQPRGDAAVVQSPIWLHVAADELGGPTSCQLRLWVEPAPTLQISPVRFPASNGTPAPSSMTNHRYLLRNQDTVTSKFGDFRLLMKLPGKDVRTQRRASQTRSNPSREEAEVKGHDPNTHACGPRKLLSQFRKNAPGCTWTRFRKNAPRAKKTPEETEQC